MKPVEIEFLMKDRLSGGIDNARMKSDLLDASLKRMAATVGTAFTLTKAIEFGKVMMDVRGQIESFQISFETLIGSKDKANAFFSEIKNFATETPLMLDDLARNAQTFLGFGIETEKVIPVLKQIGDVTMGNKDRFNAMSLAFAQMYATGKLQGQDLLQMINAGFNPLIAISEKTGKSVKQLKEEMSEGAISAEMVAQAFADVTAEGGKFHGMLQKQSEGINGMKAQFEGAIQDMLNEMGSKSEEFYAQGLQIATSLVKNYETVGKVLVGLIATYGTYKAAVIAVAAAEKAKTLIALESALAGRSLTVVEGLHAVALKKVQMAQALLNKTMLANPYVLIATAVVALGMALWALYDSTTAEEKAQKKLNDTLEETKQQKENLKGKTNELIGIIKDETQTIYAQVKAYEELKKAMPKVFSGMSREQIASMSPEDIQKAINTATDSMEFDAVNKMFTDAQTRVADLKKQLQSLMSTPSPNGGNGGAIMYLSKQIENAQADMDEAKKQLNEMNRIKIQAEFDAKPVQEKIAYYNEEIEKLDAQKRQLDTILLGNKDITSEWGQINWQTMQNISYLEFVNKMLNEMKGNLSALQNVPANANYGDLYDKAKTDWEAAKKVLSDIAKDRKKYTKEQYENAKTAEATAKKTYGDLGGDVSSSKKTSGGMTAEEKANTLKAEQKAREKQIQEYTASLVAQQKQSEFDIRQARIDAMKEGIDRGKAAIDLHYDKLIEENRLREEKWVKDLQAKINLEFENANPDWKKKGLEAPAVSEKDFAEQQKQLNDYTDSANEYKRTATAKLTADLAKQYEDYAAKRISIEKKFTADLSAMYDTNGNLLKGITQSHVNELRRQMTEALAGLDNEFLPTATAIEKLFGDMKDKAVGDMRELAAQAQGMADFVTGGEWDADKAEQYGIKTEAQFKQLNAEWSKSPEKLAAIKKGIKDLYNTADNSETAFNKMAAGLKKVFSAGGQADLKTGLSMISEGLSSVTQMADMFSDSLKNIGELSGNEIFGQIADGISTVMDVANSTMQGAQAGAAFGPIGAAVGAALGLISSITDALAAGKAQAERNAKITAEMLQKAYIGEKEVNALYRERYDWAQKIGETQLEYIQRVGEELKKQRKEAEQDADEVWAKLQNSTAKTTWDDGKRSNWLGDWAVKDVDPGWTGAESLKGKTPKEIEALYYETGVGQLSDEAKGLYELWLKLSKEKEELLKKEEEEMERIRELYTGTAYNSLVDSIIDGFKQGKRSAADFADTFEQLMAGAVSNALKMASDKKVRDYYEKFAEMSKDGLTQDEVTYLRQLWNDLINGIAADAENLKQITGTDIRTASQSGKAGAYEAASQDSITRLEGLYSSMLEHEISIDGGVENIVEGMNAALGHLKKIEENTGSSDGHLDKIEKAIEAMKDDISTIKRDGIRTR
ncbi:MAG: tape measure protein [Dysgonamonadaceae bacterium]|jgi:tape measure domain-containing protein|nr:tape measure protein [Dysgonamonadaceae bacterium]